MCKLKFLCGAYISMYLSICLFPYLSLYPSIYRSNYLYLYLYLCLCLHLHLYICSTFVFISMSISISTSISTFIYRYTRVYTSLSLSLSPTFHGSHHQDSWSEAHSPASQSYINCISSASAIFDHGSSCTLAR